MPDLIPWEIIDAVWDKVREEGLECYPCPTDMPHICTLSYLHIENYLARHPHIMREYHERNLHWDAFQ